MTGLLELSGPSYGPRAGGRSRRLVVLLHGVGADGEDLIGLAPYWAPLLPDAVFVAPDAPFPYDMAPFGRQWFSLQDRSPAMMLAGIQAAAPILNRFIDDLLAAHRLEDRDMAVVGFSQGAMMSLYVGPRRGEPCAGIVGFSGALFGADRWPSELRSRPPILLVHGDADPLVPVQAMAAAAATLRGVGFDVEAHARPGMGHGIDPAGMRLAGGFLIKAFADATGRAPDS
jgi:phospholipase/carboxylesterase